MLTVSSREFRSNQKSYLDQVAEGIDLLITRGNQSFRLSKVSDATLIDKEEYFNNIEQAIQEVHSGKVYAMKPDETLEEFLNRMEQEGNV